MTYVCFIMKLAWMLILRQQVLSERESECKDLRLMVSEHETLSAELRNKFEAALAQLEEESDQKDAEIEALNSAVEKLSTQLDQIEDDAERFKDDTERFREDDAIERERLEALVAALKEVSIAESSSPSRL